MLLDNDESTDAICLRSIKQKLEIHFEGFNISLPSIKTIINKDLKYSYKKCYYRSYEKDSKQIIESRFWLTHYIFKNNIFE